MKVVTLHEVIKTVSAPKADIWRGRCPILFGEICLAFRSPMLSAALNELLHDAAEVSVSVGIAQCSPDKCGTCRGIARLLRAT